MDAISKLIDTELSRVRGTLRITSIDQDFAVKSAKENNGLIQDVTSITSEDGSTPYNYSTFYVILNRALFEIDTLINSLQYAKRTIVICMSRLEAYNAIQQASKKEDP